MRNLHKRFHDRIALHDVTFHVDAGEIFCLLGPNGAGKSTTINILCTALSADGGTMMYHGEPIQGRHALQFRRRLGIVPQDIAIYEDISAQANVRFFASLYGLRGKTLRSQVEEALHFVGLYERRHDAPKTFSGGMKRRLNIACAIAHQPELIIMDEPTVGIDPQSRHHILQSIKNLRDQGTTVIYTTHYMEEVEAISTRIVIIDEGHIIAQGTKEQLKNNLADGTLYTIAVQDAAGLQTDRLFGVEGVKQVEQVDNTIRVAVLPGMDNLSDIIRVLVDQHMHIQHVTGSEASLETVFLQLTGRRLRD